MPIQDKAAFRCRNCGELEHAGHAAENSLPHACSVCGSGVVLHPKIQRLSQELADPKCTPARRVAIAAEMLALARAGDAEKQLVAENWEVLADATDARLKELGLSRGQVEKHAPWPKKESPDRPPQHIAAMTSSGVVAQDGVVGRKS